MEQTSLYRRVNRSGVIVQSAISRGYMPQATGYFVRFFRVNGALQVCAVAWIKILINVEIERDYLPKTFILSLEPRGSAQNLLRCNTSMLRLAFSTRSKILQFCNAPQCPLDLRF